MMNALDDQFFGENLSLYIIQLHIPWKHRILIGVRRFCLDISSKKILGYFFSISLSLFEVILLVFIFIQGSV